MTNGTSPVGPAYGGTQKKTSLPNEVNALQAFIRKGYKDRVSEFGDVNISVSMTQLKPLEKDNKSAVYQLSVSGFTSQGESVINKDILAGLIRDAQSKDPRLATNWNFEIETSESGAVITMTSSRNV